MRKFGFVVGPALGHVSRLLAVAVGFQPADDVHVTFIVPDTTRYLGLIRSHGFDVVPVMISSPEMHDGREQFSSALEDLFAKYEFDLIVQDLDPLRWMATVRWPPSIPRAIVTNVYLTHLAQTQTWQGDNFAAQSPQIDHSRKEKGLPKLNSADDLYQADRVLLADPLAVTNLYGDLPQTFVACGACYWEEEGELPCELDGVSDLLVVSAGSIGRVLLADGYLKQMKDLCGAKSVVYVGSRVDHLEENSLIDHCYEWMSLGPLLDQARMVVTHGGAGSTYQALARGIPVCVCSSSQNHNILGQILEKLGVGFVKAEGEPLPLDQMREFIQTTVAVRNLAMQMKQENGPNNIRRALLAMAAAPF